MAKRKRRVRKGAASNEVPPPKPNPFETEVLRRLVEAERRAEYAEKELTSLQDALTTLLLPTQVDAAKIAGCPPHVYALEWIKIWAEKTDWKSKVPDFSPDVQSFCHIRKL